MNEDDENVVNLFGKKFEEVKEKEPPTTDVVLEQFLQTHKEVGFDKVLLVGISKDTNDIGFGTSIQSIADINYLIDLLKNAILLGNTY